MAGLLPTTSKVPTRVVSTVSSLYCGRSEKETLAHILGACPHGELLRNSRHHKIRSLLASALRGKNYQIEEEVHEAMSSCQCALQESHKQGSSCGPKGKIRELNLVTMVAKELDYLDLSTYPRMFGDVRGQQVKSTRFWGDSRGVSLDDSWGKLWVGVMAIRDGITNNPVWEGRGLL
ncbi:hypothetical protein ANN_11973 [Periplaneta americana]|uniref:Uncharacterized protein n=1 Tax=Periplaneta americana TaxID=6978 RepID=A0ABQ8T6K1_PERAM|nr:hypothetical protein ANN_11973 [Periplaneta americana]